MGISAGRGVTGEICTDRQASPFSPSARRIFSEYGDIA